MEREILELFKAMVVVRDDIRPIQTNTDFVKRGVVLNFTPTKAQTQILDEVFNPLDIKTLFTREERENADPFELITKQLLHYIEVYGLGMPGLFDLEVTSGTILTMNYVRGITVDKLGDMVRELLYSNAPVKDATVIEKIIAEYDIDFVINDVENNELRVVLFDIKKDTFTRGDDAARFMVYMVTGDTLLIKSDEVVDAIKAATIPTDFLERHVLPLAQVFNRHKRLIIAAKKPATRTVINHISRLSKTKHVPIKEAINKTFIAKALSDDAFLSLAVLAKISVRDKFKYLNLLAWKREQMGTDAFVIRNGKMHLATDRKIWDIEDINRVEKAVLAILSMDLVHLKGENILLDSVVSYGLPISRKQTMGQLPFGTRVHVGSKRISSGMYWKNSWGATDLDLSTINTDGFRTGWGQYSGYDSKNPIAFSGDITYADTGAMEFMTSSKQEYGLFVNIYSGETGCEMEIVVGEDDDKKWIAKPIIREKIKLNSRGNVIGFVRDTDFVVYTGRLGGSRVQSKGKHPIISRGLSKFWTVNTLFDEIGIKYDVDKSKKTVYKYDVSYDGFSFDKLETLLLKEDNN